MKNELSQKALTELEEMIEKCKKHKGYIKQDYNKLKDEAEKHFSNIAYMHCDMHLSDLEKIKKILTDPST